MSLLDEIRAEAKNYIRIFDAIELIATKENTPIFEVVIYLLNKRIEENVCVFAKTPNENLEYIDDSYGGTYQKTWSALATIRDTYKEEDPKATNFDYSWLYPKLNEFTGYYWSKSEFFDFEPIKALGLEIIEDENFQESEQTDYRDIFYNYDVYNCFEVACLISNYDPNQLSINQTRKVYWGRENPKFVQALGLIMSIDKENGLFKRVEDATQYECEYIIKNADLKSYLASKNIIIEGFNDELSSQDQANCGTPSIQQTDPNINNSNAEITQLKDQLAQAQQQIKELEAGQKFQHASLDPNNKNHAPELLLAIQAWEARYINNEYPHMEHTPAIKAFLAKNGYTVTRLQERISAITNPKNINKSDN